MPRRRTGVMPGSFDPPTLAHLVVAEAARRRFSLDEVVWALSTVALGKEDGGRVPLDARVAVLGRVAADHPWLRVDATEARLVADVAADVSPGCDLVVVGADKWAQLHDPAFYADEAAMRGALARLPPMAVAPRPPHPVPGELRLDVPDWVGRCSSTLAVEAEPWLMLQAAIASGHWG